MALPLISDDDIAAVVKAALAGNRKCASIEIFTEFPSDIRQARHGIYIDGPVTIDRSPYSLAVNYGANIYTATDGFTIVLISFQGDNLMDIATEAIQSIVLDNVLLDGYHERDFRTTAEFLNRAEYRTVDFELKRIEFQ